MAVRKVRVCFPPAIRTQLRCTLVHGRAQVANRSAVQQQPAIADSAQRAHHAVSGDVKGVHLQAGSGEEEAGLGEHRSQYICRSGPARLSLDPHGTPSGHDAPERTA